MTVRWTVGGLGVIVAALAVALAVKSCQKPDDVGKIPAPVAKTLDSLEVTKPAFESHRDSVIQLVRVDTARALQAERLATAAKVEAEGFRKVADSLASLATAGADSATLWRRAYDARTAEATGLRVSLDSTTSALEAERSARRQLGALYVADTLRRSAVEGANAGLRQAIAQLEKPCRILGPIPCPSRTVSFVGGAVGAVIALSASRR